MPVKDGHPSSFITAHRLTKGERTRERILKSSLRCVCRLGFEGASLFQLAEAAKVNKGLMVHYFRTKQKLFLSLLELVGVSGRDFTAAYMRREREFPDPIERYVRATFDWYRDNPTQMSFMVLAMQRAQYDAVFRKQVDLSFSVARSRVLALLREVLPRREADASLAAAAAQIHTDLVGSVMLSVVSGGTHVSEFERRCLHTAAAIVRSLDRSR